jgi:hypothetical protein
MGREIHQKILDIKAQAKEKGWKEPHWLKQFEEILAEWDRDMIKYHRLAQEKKNAEKQAEAEAQFNAFRWRAYETPSSIGPIPTTPIQRQARLSDTQPTGTIEPP